MTRSQLALGLQSLPPILHKQNSNPIPEYSEGSGVFSSWCGEAASSPPLQFRRVSPWDSAQLVTPFVRVGTYPTRNFAYPVTWWPACWQASRNFFRDLHVAMQFGLSLHRRNGVRRIVSEDFWRLWRICASLYLRLPPSFISLRMFNNSFIPSTWRCFPFWIISVIWQNLAKSRFFLADRNWYFLKNGITFSRIELKLFTS